jgi:hypothetical protein
MQPFALIWFELHAAQQRVRDAFAQSSLPDAELHLNSSLAVAQPDGEAVRSGASHMLAKHRGEFALSNDSGGSWEYSVHEDAH